MEQRLQRLYCERHRLGEKLADVGEGLELTRIPERVEKNRQPV